MDEYLLKEYLPLAQVLASDGAWPTLRALTTVSANLASRPLDERVRTLRTSNEAVARTLLGPWPAVLSRCTSWRRASSVVGTDAASARRRRGPGCRPQEAERRVSEKAHQEERQREEEGSRGEGEEEVAAAAAAAAATTRTTSTQRPQPHEEDDDHLRGRRTRKSGGGDGSSQCHPASSSSFTSPSAMRQRLRRPPRGAAAREADHGLGLGRRGLQDVRRRPCGSPGFLLLHHHHLLLHAVIVSRRRRRRRLRPRPLDTACEGRRSAVRPAAVVGSWPTRPRPGPAGALWGTELHSPFAIRGGGRSGVAVQRQ